MDSYTLIKLLPIPLLAGFALGKRSSAKKFQMKLAVAQTELTNRRLICEFYQWAMTTATDENLDKEEWNKTFEEKKAFLNLVISNS